MERPSFNTTGVDLHPIADIDPSGNVVIAYDTTGTLSGQSSADTTDIALFSLDHSGNFLWSIQRPLLNTSQVDFRPMVILDASGNIYVTYFTNGGLTSGNTHIDPTILNDVVLYKLSKEDQPPCFNYGTQILCVGESGDDMYIPIQDIHQGMLVKTYSHGYRTVTMIGKKTFINNPNTWECCMYYLPLHSEIFDDLIVTGGHSILSDKPITDPYEVALQKQYYNGKQYRLDGKYMIPACISKRFSKILTREQFTYYHIVLDCSSDSTHYGIWANGVLTESQSPSDFMKHNFDYI
jgi:hypothetical protein